MHNNMYVDTIQWTLSYPNTTLLDCSLGFVMHAQTVDTFFASHAFQCQKRGTGDEAVACVARLIASVNSELIRLFSDFHY